MRVAEGGRRLEQQFSKSVQHQRLILNQSHDFMNLYLLAVKYTVIRYTVRSIPHVYKRNRSLIVTTETEDAISKTASGARWWNATRISAYASTRREQKI